MKGEKEAQYKSVIDLRSELCQSFWSLKLLNLPEKEPCNLEEKSLLESQIEYKEHPEEKELGVKGLHSFHYLDVDHPHKFVDARPGAFGQTFRCVNFPHSVNPSVALHLS